MLFDGHPQNLLRGLPPLFAFGFGAVVAARGQACDVAVLYGGIHAAVAVKQRDFGVAGGLQPNGRPAEIAAFGGGGKRLEATAGPRKQFGIEAAAEQPAAEVQAVAEMQRIGADNPRFEVRGMAGGGGRTRVAERDEAGPAVGQAFFAGVFLQGQAYLQAVVGAEAVAERGGVGRAGIAVFGIGLAAAQRAPVAQRQFVAAPFECLRPTFGLPLLLKRQEGGKLTRFFGWEIGYILQFVRADQQAVGFAVAQQGFDFPRRQ